jgi:hypothetical protein
VTPPSANTVREEVAARHSYGFVFVLLLCVVVWAIAAPDTSWSRIVLLLLQGATLVVAGWTSAAPVRVQRAIGAVAGVSILVAVIALALGDDARGETSLVGALLVLMTPALMLRGLRIALRDHGVTLQVVFGAIAMYLFIGIFFASAYGMVARWGADPLFGNGAGDGTLSEHYYFSMITQATVGYGDFVPGSSLARSMAVLQALIGQLYLVTVLALLVGNLGRRPQGALREAVHEREG